MIDFLQGQENENFNWSRTSGKIFISAVLCTIVQVYVLGFLSCYCIEKQVDSTPSCRGLITQPSLASTCDVAFEFYSRDFLLMYSVYNITIVNLEVLNLTS